MLSGHFAHNCCHESWHLLWRQLLNPNPNDIISLTVNRIGYESCVHGFHVTCSSPAPGIELSMQDVFKTVTGSYFFVFFLIFSLISFKDGKKDAELFSSVQFNRSVVSDCLRPHESHSTPGLPVHHQLPEFTQIHVHRVGDAIQPVMPSSHLILGRPVLLLPSIPPSIRVFSNKSTLYMRWPKYWSFNQSFQRNPRADLLQNGVV